MKLKDKVRIAFAKYISTEGCGCCRDNDCHNEARNELGKLLGASMYKDRSGYDFNKSIVKKETKHGS